MSETVRGWVMHWKLNGLPRCAGIDPWDETGPNTDHCWRLIWPWQERVIAHNGRPIHTRCVLQEAR